MINEIEIKGLIRFFKHEAEQYAKIGGMNEAWGLNYAARKLQKIIEINRNKMMSRHALAYKLHLEH